MIVVNLMQPNNVTKAGNIKVRNVISLNNV